MEAFLSHFNTPPNVHFTKSFNYFSLYFPGIILFITSIFLGWVWSVAIGLQQQVPTTVKLKSSRFKVFFFLTLIYILFWCILIGFIMNGHYIEPPKSLKFVLTFIISMRFLFIFCIFYCFYFAAKTLKTVELQRKVNFRDFVEEFFLIWFYLIGVWLIQPRINKMVK